MKIGLLSCVMSKHDRPMPAKDLYTSSLFVLARYCVERTCDRWYILSTKYGLVKPDQVIEPYNETLSHSGLVRIEGHVAGMDTIRAWNQRALEQVLTTIRSAPAHEFVIHAGRNYYDFGLADGLLEAGARVSVPLHGYKLGPRLSVYSQFRESGGNRDLAEIIAGVHPLGGNS